MLFTSQILTAVSGSVGGLVGSHNNAGLYFRARAVPVDPQTTLQVAVRNIIGQLSNRWVGTLTDAQRAGWEDYAKNVPLPARLGGTHVVSGIAMYQRSNIARRQAGLLRVDDAPIEFDVGEFTSVTAPTATAAGDLVGADFDPTDNWANETGSAMLVYAGIAVNPSVSFFKGPYRFAGRVDGDTTIPPTSPFSLGSGYGYQIGQKVHFRVVVARKDARFSFDQKTFAIAA